MLALMLSWAKKARLKKVLQMRSVKLWKVASKQLKIALMENRIEPLHSTSRIKGKTQGYESLRIRLCVSFVWLHDKSLTLFQGELQQRIVGLNNELSQSREQVRQYTAQVQQLQTQLSTTASTPNVRVRNKLDELRLTIPQTETQQITTAPSDELAQTIEAKNKAEDRVRQLQAQVQELDAQKQAVGDLSEDVEKLKEELAASQKEVEDLRTRLTISESSAAVGEGEPTESVSAQIAQQVAVIKEDLEAKHEERTSAAERDADERARQAEEKAKARTESMKEKLNAKIKQIRQEHQEAIEKLQAEHETELAELRQQLQTATETSTRKEDSAAAETKAAVPAIDDVTHLTKEQVQAIVKDNEHAQVIIRNTVRSQFASKEQKMKEEHARELEELKQQHAKVVEELVAKAATAPAGISPEELEKRLEEAKAKVKEEQTKMNLAKISLIQNRAAKLKAQVDVVAKAAEETPQRPVVEVWEVAKEAKPPAAQPAAAPATPGATQQTPTKPGTPSQPAQPGQNGQAQAGPPAALGRPHSPGMPQANGATPGNLGQPGTAQSPFSQPNPFGPGGYPIQGQGMPQNRMQMPNQIPPAYGGPSGIMAPGFMGGQMQPQPGMRPESPFAQGQQPQMPQQGGRGRGHENVGTGPAALRSLVGQSQAQGGIQSGIPRPGGGGIPRPSGRGQGGQQAQPPAAAQTAGGAQAGRGGGRSGRGGRQGQQQGNSPGGNLNPNAPGFQPGGGRGQKRTREDGGDGDGHQGGKRPRGGRGGA
ncbi:uncharacterized protein EI97DRAFT_325833 [Westerdykella ornata]|uniref:Nucleoprotein TPR/MLP1 domain-containing protein n=1 Tax=Westerdykella ornata TaxID=318751 RepID=A0A6A6JJV6_WESOR|nr:uncharacterized protein EI97DRAFT_325833 [Westerdykella ornata]KAF2276930.1 hypothetical protein EI97DRAFT_325833 [Westerdykella ornata]